MELEHQIGRKLTGVCIAAAGRVLKTVTVEVEERLGDENFQDELITAETIHSLEMIGIEKAYEVIRKETQDENVSFYCVGYTVVHYYLNNNMITNLEGHKGNRIAAQILATFLPQEVIDGLYAATEKAGLEVDNLTLEPIRTKSGSLPPPPTTKTALTDLPPFSSRIFFATSSVISPMWRSRRNSAC